MKMVKLLNKDAEKPELFNTYFCFVFGKKKGANSW